MNIKKLGLNELMFLYFNLKNGKVKNNIPEYFIAESIIKTANKTTNVVSPDIDKKDYLELRLNGLNKNYDFQENKFIIEKKKIKIKFENEKHLSLEQYLNNIYQEIKKRYIFLTTEKFSEIFAIQAFVFRGSFDLTANYLTTDMHPSRTSSKEYIGNLIKLISLTNLDSQLNLNFRQLQKQYVDNTSKRATQFRINLHYFYTHYYKKIKEINPYRYQQFIDNSKSLTLKNDAKDDDNNFIQRISFYQKNIVNKQNIDVNKLREMLDFNELDGKLNKEKKRSNNAKNFAQLNALERCAACCNQYETKDRTFKRKNSDFWYFELHHVISFANKEIQTEVPENYVKLCPTCHRALTPNRTQEEYQKTLINNILENNDETKEYVENIKKSTNETGKSNVDYVFEKLK